VRFAAPARVAFAPAPATLGLGLAATRSFFRSTSLAAESEGAGSRGQENRENQLFVGNIPFTVDGAQLNSMFADYGVQDAKIVYDQQSGRSKGIAFLTFSNAEQATKAQAAMNGAVRPRRRSPFLAGVAADAPRARRSSRAATSAWRRASRPASAGRTSRASSASRARAARRRVAACTVRAGRRPPLPAPPACAPADAARCAARR
jgi:hypothetical protein